MVNQHSIYHNTLFKLESLRGLFNKFTWFFAPVITKLFSLRKASLINFGSLPFTLENRLVDSCSKWDVSNLNGNFRGDALVPFSTRLFLGRQEQRQSKSKGLELVKLANETHIFHLEIPFGNFGLPFKKSRFPEKISVPGRRTKALLVQAITLY